MPGDPYSSLQAALVASERENRELRAQIDDDAAADWRAEVEAQDAAERAESDALTYSLLRRCGAPSALLERLGGIGQ